jgi:hypothetical protein
MKKKQSKITNHSEQQPSERLEIDGQSHDSHHGESGPHQPNNHQTKNQETDQAPPINIYQPQ